MKLPRTEDTAILMVSEISENYRKGPVTLSAIARRHGLSFLFLKKLARNLRMAGLISGREGLKGGYELNKSPDEINVWQIISAVRDISKIHKSPSPEVCPLNDRCLPQSIERSIDIALETSLSKITLSVLKEKI
jgi:Rrf2 family protein